MELYEGLLSRRSIRRYTGGKIPEADIEKIIRAGMYAPSANNKRPWHFIVVDDREILNRIMEAHPYAGMLSKASHAIVVCGDLDKQNAPGYYLLDCSAAIQNVLLAIHALGYGGVWLAVEPRMERINAVSEILGLPAHVRPVAVISAGIPSGKPPKIPQRFEPGKIRRNKWKKK
ncbi:MAG TPA: nitroreductase family protein [Bacteroidales bacterium]|nr:nitroreductase family protein [Bacteroidales bacterium]